jgi:superfamily I DNA/RNA helicase
VTEDGRAIIECPITQTRRCPKNIVNFIQPIVPDFEALPDAPDGEVLLIDQFFAYAHIGEGRRDTLVIARTNAALASFAIKLVKRGIPVEFISRDLGTELVKMTRQYVYAYKAKHSVAPSLQDYIEELVRKIGVMTMAARGRAQKAAAILALDKLEVMLTLAAAATDWEDYFKSIAVLFGSDLNPEMQKRAVRFSTVHSIKGDEAQFVIIAGGDNMPHPLAESPIELEQEWNLLYVACTRAVECLWFLDTVPARLADSPYLERMV